MWQEGRLSVWEGKQLTYRHTSAHHQTEEGVFGISCWWRLVPTPSGSYPAWFTAETREVLSAAWNLATLGHTVSWVGNKKWVAFASILNAIALTCSNKGHWVYNRKTPESSQQVGNPRKRVYDMSLKFTEDVEADELVSSCFPCTYLGGMALEAVSTETLKIALFCLIIETVNYSRNKWLAGKQQLAGVNEMARSSL